MSNFAELLESEKARLSLTKEQRKTVSMMEEAGWSVSEKEGSVILKRTDVGSYSVDENGNLSQLED